MANESEVFARPNALAKIHDFEQFTFWAASPDRPGYRARMVFGERNGAPRVSMFPNSESGPKVVSAGMAPLIFLELLERIEAIAQGPNGQKDKLENLDMDPNAERTDNFDDVAKIPRNVFHFGKGEDGVCWMAMQQANVPNIRFTILSSAWHHFFKKDGTRITPEEGSVSQTMALVAALRMAVAPYIARLRPAYDKDAARAPAKPALAGSSMSSIDIEEDLPY
jgi:hypothetical protein